MSNDPVRPGTDADDLLGRWFAHHEQAAADDRAAAADDAADPVDAAGAAAPPRHIPLAARASEAAAPRLTRPSASAALAELRATPPASPRDGVRDAGREVAELDRPSPVGFEPVILASVRKKSESQGQEKMGGRLSRLRSRVAGPVDEPGPPEQDPAVPHDETAAAVLPPVVPPPVEASVVRAPLAAPEPGAPPRKLLPYEEVIALATQASLPVVDPEPEPAPEPEPVLPGPDTEPAPVVPEPEPEPMPEPDPEPVLPGPDTEPAPVVPEPEPMPEPDPEPVLPGPDTEPAPVQQDGAPKRRLVTRTKRPDGDAPEERRRRPAAGPRHASAPATGTGGAARGLLAAARAATPVTPVSPPRPVAARPVPVPASVPVPVPLPVPAPELVPVPEPEPVRVQVPTDETLVEAPPPAPAMEMPAIYQFAPLKSARRFLSLMFVTGLATSGYLGYGAYQSRDTMEIGIAAIVTLATLVIWAIRAGATVTRLTVRRGQLEIARQGGRMVFDLASTYTAIEVVGRPGSKTWKVLFHRRGMSPVVVDSSMVDARDFMRVLRFFRPDLGPGSTPKGES